MCRTTTPPPSIKRKNGKTKATNHLLLLRSKITIRPTHHPNTTHPPPKITTTFSFSPSKHLLKSQFKPKPKRPKVEIPNLPSSNTNKHTPLEQQVTHLKSKYPDVLLMIEVGYKYRFFGEDAEIAAKVLSIYAFPDKNFITDSVPTHRLHFHLKRLVTTGYKVGVVKQTETAAIKAHGDNRIGPFGRELDRVYTKATLKALEECGQEEEGCGSSSSYLVCVVEREMGSGVRIGAVGIEVSTGDFVYGEFEDGVVLESMVMNLLPVEGSL